MRKEFCGRLRNEKKGEFDHHLLNISYFFEVEKAPHSPKLEIGLKNDKQLKWKPIL